MKKLSLIFVILMSAYASMYAQSIHYICFADTNDEKIGRGVSKDVNKMMNFVMTLATSLDMEERLQPAIVMMGKDCNSTNLKSIIKEFTCGPQDIVIFYYSGHGARSVNDKSEFPHMCLGSSNQSNFVPLEYVKDAIVQKGPRLCLVMGDCCNNYSRWVLPKDNILRAASEPTRLGPDQTGLKKLFMETSGSIITSGSQKGEYSWSNSSEGGFFTSGFLRVLDSYTSSSRSTYDWNELLGRVRSKVAEYSKQALANQGNYVQTPIYKVDLKKASAIPVVNVTIKDGIRTAMMSIADASKAPGQRIGLYKSTLSSFFASSDSMIDIVGQDQQTLVNYTTAGDYLLRLATVSGLANFTILEEKKDSNGKIVYLKLHEIYK